ncbi:Stigma-specific protein Stig1 [Macleaya cordata]|uniref:Stigma-specific protein Stig1 n=1 Tax=Macleaya cordata TaxID=56857 RepID=A0A200RCL2_MACCD|nr:Stigma-specific protein Stig1 [Macleaya cordata]
MKLIKVFVILVVAIVMALLVVGISASPSYEEDDDKVPSTMDEAAINGSFGLMSLPDNQSEEKFSLRRLITHFRAHKMHKHKMTCKKYPTICQAKGSPGPHCCKNKCVNVLKDRQNCGMCGKKCKHTDICCGGKCINPSFDKRHCGGCNNRCNADGFCTFGLCNYA